MGANNACSDFIINRYVGLLGVGVCCGGGVGGHVAVLTLSLTDNLMKTRFPGAVPHQNGLFLLLNLELN